MLGTWELLVYREVAYFRVVMSCNVVLQSMSVLKVALHFLFFLQFVYSFLFDFLLLKPPVWTV